MSKSKFIEVLKGNSNRDAAGRFASVVDVGDHSQRVPTGGSTTIDATMKDKGQVAEGKATVSSTGAAVTSGNQGHSSTSQDLPKDTKVPGAVFDTAASSGRAVRNGMKQQGPSGTQYSGGLERKRNPKYAPLHGDK